MSDKLLWKHVEIKNYISAVLQYKFLHRPVRWKHWAGRKCLDGKACNELIFNAILSGKPFVAARFGHTEMINILAAEQNRIMNKTVQKIDIDLLWQWSGVFGFDETNIQKFVDLYLRDAKQVDLLGIWLSKGEEYLLRKYAPKAKLTALKNLEPYYEEEIPWSRALQDKKVLVIHPFADTITSQYAKREKLWKNKDILPEFSLVTFKAVQTLCGETDDRFSTWFDALDYMIEEVKNIDFDVALIGCGAYGLPLACAVKEMGKQAIHLGGALQILFGIIGKRWEEKPFFKTLMNEHWVRPSEEERPQNAKSVEGGCYW